MTQSHHGLSRPPAGRVEFERAYYIKLGAGGEHAESSFSEGLLRLGWRGQSVIAINEGRWKEIEDELWADEQRLRPRGPIRRVVTNDLNALKRICASTAADVWITFHASHLWWCRLTGTPVEADTVSKFRRVAGHWYNTDVTGGPLRLERIPGPVAQTQGFRATACAVKKAVDVLRRLLNAEDTPGYREALAAKEAFATRVADAIRLLQPKEFEILVDLLFRGAGWRRVTMLGGPMPDFDLVLEEPLTHERYAVQVKCGAGLADFKLAVTNFEEFSREDLRRLYFVVHTPTDGLADPPPGEPDPAARVELMGPQIVARHVVDMGLASWVLEAVRFEMGGAG